MTTDLLMPALSPTMEQGTIAKWLVREGDRIAPGDLLAEIETDKATMEMEASDGGVILAIMVAEGSDEVKVGTPIARLGTGDEASPSPSPTPSPGPSAGEAEEQIIDRLEEPTSATAGLTDPAEDTMPVSPPLSLSIQDPAVASTPLARKLASALGADLSSIKGTGQDGSVRFVDVRGPSPQRPDDADPPRSRVTEVVPALPSRAPASSTSQPNSFLAPYRSERLSSMRRTIARRLTEAKQTVPHFYLGVDCRIDALLDLRARLNGEIASSGVKVSVNDFLIKALAHALVQVPAANVCFGDDALHVFERVDVAIAVAIEGGLLTPVITDAAGRSISSIARAARTFAEDARAGRLAPETMHGGTVSLSNLGMFGMSEIIPILNPPQAMIVGVGAGEEKWVPEDGRGVVAKIMRATGSFDHRAIDGATAAEAMQAFRRAVENPFEILC